MTGLKVIYYLNRRNLMRSKTWQEGFAAYGTKDVQDNPYHLFDDGHDDWTDGWLAAQKLEEE
jgi:hypothetical protein